MAQETFQPLLSWQARLPREPRQSPWAGGASVTLLSLGPWSPRSALGSMLALEAIVPVLPLVAPAALLTLGSFVARVAYEALQPRDAI